MNPVLRLCIVLFWSAVTSHGQGLLDQDSIFLERGKLPFSASIASVAGWDSQPGAGFSNNGRGGVSDNGGSTFWRNSVTLATPITSGDSQLQFSGNYANLWYLEAPEGTPEFLNTGGGSLSYTRNFDDRLRIGDNLYASYRTEPDYDIGLSVSRPTSGHFIASNRIWLSYKWSTRLTSVLSNSINWIGYSDSQLTAENYWQVSFSHQLRYALSTRTVGSFEYRNRFSRYEDNATADSTSNYFLLGMDRPLGRFLSMGINAGAEIRSYEGALGDQTTPHIEGAVNYLGREGNSFRLYYRRGAEDTGRAGSQRSNARRVGLTLSRKIGRYLAANIGIAYVNSEYKSQSAIPRETESLVHATAGISYTRPLWRHLNLICNYSFSMTNSNDPSNEYTRHMASLGLGLNF